MEGRLLASMETLLVICGIPLVLFGAAVIIGNWLQVVQWIRYRKPASPIALVGPIAMFMGLTLAGLRGQGLWLAGVSWLVDPGTVAIFAWPFASLWRRG